MQLQQRLFVAAPITQITYTPPPRQNIPHGFIEAPSRHESWASSSSMQNFTRASPTSTEITNGGSAGGESYFKAQSQHPVESLSRTSTAPIEADNKKRSFFGGVFGKQKSIPEAPLTPAVNLPHGATRIVPPTILKKDELLNGALSPGLGLNLPQPEIPQLIRSRVSSVSTMSSTLPEAERQETDPFYDPWKNVSSPRQEYPDSQLNSYTSFAPDTVPAHTAASSHRTSTSSHLSWSSRDNSSSHRSSQSSNLSWSPPATAPLNVTKRPTLASISEPSRGSTVSSASGHSWLSQDSISNHRTSQVSDLSWADSATSAPEVDQRPRQASSSAPEVVTRPRQPSVSAPEVYQQAQLASVSTLTQRLSTVSTGSSIRQPSSPNMLATVQYGPGGLKGNLPNEDNKFAGFCKGMVPIRIFGTAYLAKPHNRRLAAPDRRQQKSH